MPDELGTIIPSCNVFLAGARVRLPPQIPAPDGDQSLEAVNCFRREDAKTRSIASLKLALLALGGDPYRSRCLSFSNSYQKEGTC